MDKGLFANDGSFMERFKQMQQGKEKTDTTGASTAAPTPVNPKTPIVIPMNKRPLEVKKAVPVLSGGKLAFSLKKNKVPIAPVKFGAEEEDDEDDVSGVKREDHAKRHKSVDAPSAAAPARVVASATPNDMTVRQVADKLASFVAKNGRQFEDITRQRNPGDSPFKFLFDKNSSDYRYYETRLAEEEKVLAQTKDAQASKIANSSTVSSSAHSGSQRSSFEHKSNYQTPASALYGTYEGSSSHGGSSSHDLTERNQRKLDLTKQQHALRDQADGRARAGRRRPLMATPARAAAGRALLMAASLEGRRWPLAACRSCPSPAAGSVALPVSVVNRQGRERG